MYQCNSPPLNRDYDYDRDPNVKVLRKRVLINQGSTSRKFGLFRGILPLNAFSRNPIQTVISSQQPGWKFSIIELP